MAAGLGFKTFTTGEVLTAADVNGYLMQGVLVFATEAARNSAITSPQEGQFAFTKDTNSLWYYTGSAWAASGATGDIEGVTAGTGISGGGTSGTVTITNSMATEITAKGDLIVGTGNAAFDNLPVGTNGHILTADSTVSPTGLKWAAPAGGGKVLQVVSATHTGQASSSSTTFADTGLTVNITPSSATSKVLVMATSIVGKTNGNANSAVHTRIVRNSTGVSENQLYNYTNTALELTTTFSQVYLDSPNTTSSTTYKIQFKNAAAVAEVYFGWNSTNSQIIVMEIGA